jgi:tight adherence protein B
MSATVFAAAAAAGCGWLATGGSSAAVERLRRLDGPAATRSRALWVTPQVGRLTPAGVGVATALVSGVALGPAAVLPAGLAAAEFVRRTASTRRMRAADALRRDVAHWCAALATELHIGRTANEAMVAANDESSAALAQVLAPVVAVAQLGGDVGAALLHASGTRGTEALRYVGASWSLAAETGAGLAVSLQSIAFSLQAADRVRGEVSAQLAAAQASARLLAVLPAFGLLLGEAVGAHPLRFLLDTPVGAACLCATVVLNVCGLRWTDRIAAGVALP